MADDPGLGTGSHLAWHRRRDAVRLIVRGSTVKAVWPTTLVVGTVLSAVNQGDVIASGDVTLQTWLRIAVNYIVPFLVASTGFLSAHRRRGGQFDL